MLQRTFSFYPERTLAYRALSWGDRAVLRPVFNKIGGLCGKRPAHDAAIYHPPVLREIVVELLWVDAT